MLLRDAPSSCKNSPPVHGRSLPAPHPSSVYIRSIPVRQSACRRSIPARCPSVCSRFIPTRTVDGLPPPLNKQKRHAITKNTVKTLACGANSKETKLREGWNGDLLLYQPGRIDKNKWRSSVVRRNVVFVALLKMSCDLILINSIDLNSHLNCHAVVVRENAHARRTPGAKLRGKLA